MMKRAFLGLVLGLALGTAAQAQEEVTERLQSTSLSFSGGRDFTNAVLTVNGPDGYLKEETTTRGLPIFRLQTAGRLVDGFYSYSLVAASDEEMPVNTSIDNGRGEAAKDTMLKPFSMYGTFRVEAGLLTASEGDGGESQDGG